MDPTLTVTIAASIAVLFVFVYWLSRRGNDLIEQLAMALKELRADVYVVEKRIDGTGEIIFLKNPFTAVTYRNDGEVESLAISLFFENKEHSGANRTWISRKCKMITWRTPISYKRVNILQGVLFYEHAGHTYRSRAHELFSQIVCEIERRKKFLERPTTPRSL